MDKNVTQDLGVYLHDPPVLLCDNVSTLAIASNLVFHARTNHIEVDYHFVREKVLRHDLQVKFVASQDQQADIPTKGLASPHFLWLKSKLMWQLPLSLRGMKGVRCRLQIAASDTVEEESPEYKRCRPQDL